MARIATVAGRPVSRRLTGLSRPSLIVILATIPALLILLLVGVVLWISTQESVLDPTFTLRHYAELYTNPAAYTALLNTIVFALSTVFWAVAFGLPIAWLVERTDLGKKTAVSTLMTLGILIPGFMGAIGWLLLAHPRSGLISRWLRDTFGIEPPIDLLTWPAMGWIEGLTLAAVVFILTGASLRSMDHGLEEAAQMSGASLGQTMRRITFPLVLPGLLGAAIFVLTIAISTFDVPLLIGLSNRTYVFSTFLFLQVRPHEGIPAYEVTAAFGALMVLLGLGLGYLYARVLSRGRTYEVVSGKSYRPRLVRLGAWRPVAWAFIAIYLALSIVLPLLVLVWTALLPFPQVPSPEAFERISLRNFTGMNLPLFGSGARNTAALMLLAPSLALLMAVLLSWVVLRTRSRLRYAYDFVAFLPQAVPRVVFAFGAVMLTAFYLKGPVDLYGTLALLVIVMALVQIAFATRLVNASLIQIHHELEEAARVAGAGTLTVLRRVTLPLIRPALVYGWLWLAMLSYRDLTLPAVLGSKDNVTLSMVVYDSYRTGLVGQAAAVIILMVLVLSPLIALYWRIGGAGRGARV